MASSIDSSMMWWRKLVTCVHRQQNDAEFMLVCGLVWWGGRCAGVPPAMVHALLESMHS